MKLLAGPEPERGGAVRAANKLRGSVESAEYKHLVLVLGLIFLKYISDSFSLRREQLEAELSSPDSDLYTKDPEEREEAHCAERTVRQTQKTPLPEERVTGADRIARSSR